MSRPHLRSLRPFFLSYSSSLLPLLLTLAASQPYCDETCGDLAIEYPFGIHDGCFLPGFRLNCSESKTYMIMNINSTSYLQVLSMNITAGQLRVRSPAAGVNNSCDKQLLWYYPKAWIDLPENGPFTISSTSNKLIAVGCNTKALVYEPYLTSSTGCFSTCSEQSNITDGLCAGVGCCEARPPMRKKKLKVAVATAFNLIEGTYANCSKAFIAEDGKYVFTKSDIENATVPDTAFVLDWTVNNSEGLCGGNAAYNSTYQLCRCHDGYEGNPYLKGSERGCKDIDECSKGYHNCLSPARCENKVPRYQCSCPFGSIREVANDGTRCSKIVPIIGGILGSVGVLLLLFLSGTWTYWVLRKKRTLKLKEEYFKKNGGILLSQKMSSSSHGSGHSKIFSASVLEQATDNYHERNILGSGGYGTVYKGVLPKDKTVVAIKKSRVIDQTQVDQFINEVTILTQVNHRNVVKLLGCCLETEVPLLVYAYISNGTLYQHIHEQEDPALRISWPDRLRIAKETAEALAYLHSAATIPIYHRDVKSANILLDAKLTAKVSDFGASRLIPFDHEVQVATVVQGTLGYLDPEYLQTTELSDKSDVYSFGVVLAELLTGEKPVDSSRPRETTNLASYFLLLIRNNELDKILDQNVVREGTAQMIHAVATIAERCLQSKGENRPTMKEVAQDLALIDGDVVVQHHAWMENRDETESLLRMQEVVTSSYGFDHGNDSGIQNLAVTHAAAR